MTRFRPFGTLAVTVLAFVSLAAGCGGQATEPEPTSLPGPGQSSQSSQSSSPSNGQSSSEPSDRPSPQTSAPDTPATPDLSLVEGWTLEQKVGQIVMVGLPVGGPHRPTLEMIDKDQIGGVFLHGRSEAGADPVKSLVGRVRDAAATAKEPLFVATDQEGGEVQVLRGPGFSDLPSALDQAALSTSDLRASSRAWGDELAAVGVNLNLAPVLDLVPQDAAASNAPIGVFGRSYGYTAQTVVSHGNAFAQGQRDAGVQTSIKHFPGLGRVTGNTDTTAGVTDTVTGPDDPSVAVFGAGIEAGSGLVMMSSAVYDLIDPEAPAVFSPRVVGLVRELGFDGVIISDDLSGAVQVESVPVGRRAVRAVDAGVDLVLASARPSVAPTMVKALTRTARDHPEFAAKVDAAAARVVAAKARLPR